MPVSTLPDSIKSIDGKRSDFFGRQKRIFPTNPKPGRQPCKLCCITPNNDALMWRLHTDGASLRSILNELSPRYHGITIYPQNIQRHLVHLEYTIATANH